MEFKSRIRRRRNINRISKERMKADRRIEHIKPLRRKPLKTQSFKNRVNGNKITIKEDKIYVNGKFSHMSIRHRVTDEEIASLHHDVRQKIANLINEINSIQNKFIFQIGNFWKNGQLICHGGFRSKLEQKKIHSIGRDREGNIIGEIKTKAKELDSYHNYGLASDCALIEYENGKLKSEPQWNKKVLDKYYEKYIIPILNKYGAEWGGKFKDFKDYPHIEFKFNCKIKNLKKLYTDKNPYINLKKCKEMN